MIHALYLTIRAALKAKGVPFECVYGPTQVPPNVGASRIQFLRDYDAGDAPAPPRARVPNPRMIAVRATSGIVRIHAQSTIAGAQRHDHEDLADRIVDQVHVELHKAVAAAKTLYRVTRLSLVSDDSTDGWAGVVYEIHFQVDRGVYDRTWTGEAMHEAAPTIVTTLTADGPPAVELPSATTRIQ